MSDTTSATRAAAFAQLRFGDRAQVQPLSGDASDRRFFRLFAPNLSPLILMVHQEPFELERLPFFLHGRFLEEIGAAVPSIVASYPKEGILVVQDLGDETLQSELKSCDASRRRFLYLQAVQMIAFMQQEGTRALTPDLPAATAALDTERLLYELRFFTEHYVDGLLGSALTPSQAEELDEWFVSLSRQVAAYPRVLCHRDFHSRNLMVKRDRLYMVDFQDARMGPYTYDLASLARDSYVKLPDELVAELIEFYRETVNAPEPPHIFLHALNRTSLQRNIKAIGSFASQVTLKDNRQYLPYIRPTLDSVRARLEDAGDDPAAAAIRDLFGGPLDYR